MGEQADATQATPGDEITVADVPGDEKAKLAFVKSFTITWKNRETGVVQVGTFTVARPGLGAFGKIGVLKAKLNGGMAVDPLTDFNHQMMADLHYILTSFPDWWKPDEFYTADPLRKVWDHVVAWLNTFRPGSAG